MCGSYVHGYTNWPVSVSVTFTVLFVTTTHKHQVHLTVQALTAKYKRRGRHQSTLAAPECRSVQQIKYPLQTIARQSFNFSNAKSKQPQRTVASVAQSHGCRLSWSGWILQRLLSLCLHLYSTSVQSSSHSKRKMKATTTNQLPLPAWNESSCSLLLRSSTVFILMQRNKHFWINSEWICVFALQMSLFSVLAQ